MINVPKSTSSIPILILVILLIILTIFNQINAEEPINHDNNNINKNKKPSNIPNCLATGKCKFWGKQFDCSMCPGARNNNNNNKKNNENQKLIKEHEKEKSSLEKEIENLISSKRLMIKELNEALANMVEDNELSVKQKRNLLDRLGMKSNDDTVVHDKYKSNGFEHIVSVRSIYDDGIRLNNKDIKFLSKDIDQPIIPDIHLGNDVIVHKFLIQRYKRLRRKLKKMKKRKIRRDSLTLLLKEQQVEMFAMHRRYNAKRRRHSGNNNYNNKRKNRRRR